MNATRRLSLTTALLAAATLTGCLGFGTLEMRKDLDLRPTAMPEFAEHRQPIVEDDLLALLGEPDRRKTDDDGLELWTYKQSRRFTGLILFVVIPLPLALPIGRESDTYVIDNGEVISVDRVYYHQRYTTCGVVRDRCLSLGCQVWGDLD